MQAVRSGVEAAVGGRRPRVEQGPERLVTHLVDKSAKGEVLRELQHRAKRATTTAPGRTGGGGGPGPACRARRTGCDHARARPTSASSSVWSATFALRSLRTTTTAGPRRAAAESAASSCSGSSSREVTSIVVAARRPGEVGHVDPLGRAEQPLEIGLVERRGLGQEREDAATAVVDDDQHRGENGLAPAADKSRRIVQEGEVAEQPHDGPTCAGGGGGHPEGRGRHAVDAVGTAVGKHPRRVRARGREPLEVPHGHRRRRHDRRGRR